MPNQRLPGGQLKEKQFQISCFAAFVPPGTDVQTILNPDYWLNYADTLVEGCEINVLSEDYDLDVLLRVLRIEPHRILVRVMSIRHEPNQKQQPAKTNVAQKPDGLRIKWTNNRSKFVVIKDNKIIKEGFANKEQAEEYVKNLTETV